MTPNGKWPHVGGTPAPALAPVPSKPVIPASDPDTEVETTKEGSDDEARVR